MGDHSNNYKVTGPCALVNTDGGQAVMVMNGGPLPSNATQDAIDHLLSVGLITKGDVEGGLPPVRSGANPVPVVDPADDPDGPGGIPAKSASKQDWIDYAVSQGATADEANAATKDQLIEQYGTPKPADPAS